MASEVTRKRILFVDDEPLVLQGLQRMLRSMRNEWDMEFAESGVKALQIMDERPFDVVVSDMRMPGMNGAELLNTVMAKYPNTVRIILSGHADQDMIALCLGSAHQYLSKPCDPELLKTLVHQACRLGGEVPNDRVKEVIGRIDNLPRVPDVYRELTKALNSREVSSQELGRIIAHDIAMTAKILKLVNSAFFGLRRELSSPVDAVTYLGIETVRSLVLANEIFGQIETLKTQHIGIDDVWNHSLRIAHGARTVAQAMELPETIQEQTFIGGLLHDCGMLILAHAFPSLYDEAVDLVIRENYLTSMAEQRLFGVNHSEVGAYLMGLWGLPHPIVEVIRTHHSPSSPEAGGLQAVHFVHLADVFLCNTSNYSIFGHAFPEPSLLKHPSIEPKLAAIKQWLHAGSTAEESWHSKES